MSDTKQLSAPSAPSVLAPFPSPPCGTWFERRFAAPTDAQAEGWPAIRSGRDTLIAAPTGSGKTLAAFLAGIDSLIRRGQRNDLEDRVEILYVSPLKALGSDIHRNLESPLREIREIAQELGQALPEIRIAVRSGDTTPSERQAITRRPPPHSHYDTGIALFDAHRGEEPAGTWARQDAHCGRDSRVGAGQTREPPGAVVGSLGPRRRAAAQPRGVVGDAAAH